MEMPGAVVDRTVEPRGTRQAAAALAAHRFSEVAQTIVAAEGFRPTNPSVGTREQDRFAPLQRFFPVQEFGCWKAVHREFFGDGGLWGRLFARARRIRHV